jgi:hypothetical protein
MREMGVAEDEEDAFLIHARLPSDDIVYTTIGRET